MTLRAAQKIFEKLRNDYPESLPNSFSTKHGRHTLSAGLERIMARAGVKKEDRAKYLMAIRGDSSEKSQDPYIGETIEITANKYLIKYQQEVLMNGADEDVPF